MALCAIILHAILLPLDPLSSQPSLQTLGYTLTDAEWLTAVNRMMLIAFDSSIDPSRQVWCLKHCISQTVRNRALVKCIPPQVKVIAWASRLLADKRSVSLLQVG